MRLAYSGEHEPVNIGNPSEFTILECARLVLQVTGSNSEITYEPLPQDDPSNADPTSLRPGACWAGSPRSIWRPG